MGRGRSKGRKPSVHSNRKSRARSIGRIAGLSGDTRNNQDLNIDIEPKPLGKQYYFSRAVIEFFATLHFLKRNESGAAVEELLKTRSEKSEALALFLSCLGEAIKGVVITTLAPIEDHYFSAAKPSSDSSSSTTKTKQSSSHIFHHGFKQLIEDLVYYEIPLLPSIPVQIITLGSSISTKEGEIPYVEDSECNIQVVKPKPVFLSVNGEAIRFKDPVPDHFIYILDRKSRDHDISVPLGKVEFSPTHDISPIALIRCGANITYPVVQRKENFHTLLPDETFTHNGNLLTSGDLYCVLFRRTVKQKIKKEEKPPATENTNNTADCTNLLNQIFNKKRKLT